MRKGTAGSQKQYLALLRGINVGGKNIMRMTLLKACLEKMGLEEVLTYIQSGNVLFSSTEKSIDRLTAKVERVLSKQFNYESRVVVVSRDTLEAGVKRAPRGFGKDPAKYRYDVIFLKKPLTADEVMKSVKVKEGVDAAWPGQGVIYFSRLIRQASQSQLSRIVGLPVYQSMTIRNWNTVTKLLALMQARAELK
jgi:uncharacterized protein (DUF1697 family)